MVYDLFYDELPDVDNVKEMLNLFALVTTLFIGGVYGLVGSVYDELHRVDEMWTNKTYVVDYYSPGSFNESNAAMDTASLSVINSASVLDFDTILCFAHFTNTGPR